MRLFAISILFFPLSILGQKTFLLPDGASFVTIREADYKIHFVSSNIKYQVSSNQTQLFEVDTSIYVDIEIAIREQYVSAFAK